jgi:hypothetical protein
MKFFRTLFQFLIRILFRPSRLSEKEQSLGSRSNFCPFRRQFYGVLKKEKQCCLGSAVPNLATDFDRRIPVHSSIPMLEAAHALGSNFDETEHSFAKTARFNCASNGFKCSLDVCLTDTIFNLAALLAERMQCLTSELLLISKGRILSRCPKSTLVAFGFTAGGTYKLLINRRPARPVWLRLTAHFLACSLPPTPLRMHATSPAINIKRQLRELLRIPYLSLSIHLSDGEALPDSESLRDLGLLDGARVYCRIHCDDPPPAEAVETGRVLELILRADPEAGGGGGRPKRRRDAESEPLPGAAAARDCGGGGWRRGDEPFLGMRRGFLSGRPARRAAPARTESAQPADGAAGEAEEASAAAA